MSEKHGKSLHDPIMRTITQLGVLSAVSAGPREDLCVYLRHGYGMSKEPILRAAKRLEGEGLVTSKRSVRNKSNQIVTLVDAYRGEGDKSFAAITPWLDPLAHVAACAVSEELSDYRRAAGVTPYSAEWRLLLTMLRLGESNTSELTAEAMITPAPINSALRGGLVVLTERLRNPNRRPPNEYGLIPGRDLHVYDLTPNGTKRAHAALALGRRMLSEWQGDQHIFRPDTDLSL